MQAVVRRGFSAVARGPAAIDVHTHVYLPRYLQVLRNRTTVPRVFTSGGEDRLVILPGEDSESSTAAGRPIGTEYSDPKRKIAFMDMHNIAASVLSLANPWLEFVSGKPAAELATALNQDLQEQCELSNGRFYGFGVLPSDDVDASCRELERIAKLDKLRGIIVSAKGLDDARLLPVYQTAEELGQVLFVHPHNGVGTENYGGFGHALFLALGFPFETTTAVARLVCSGMMDKVPDLKLLIAHTGGTLPFLAGRLDSCVAGDEHMAGRLKHAPSHYLKKFYYDAIAYHGPTLVCGQTFCGTDNLMFGTDHPFFPPPGVAPGPGIDAVPWKSCTSNQAVIAGAGAEDAKKILQDNASKLLRIPLPKGY